MFPNYSWPSSFQLILLQSCSLLLLNFSFHYSLNKVSSFSGFLICITMKLRNVCLNVSLNDSACPSISSSYFLFTSIRFYGFFLMNGSLWSKGAGSIAFFKTLWWGGGGCGALFKTLKSKQKGNREEGFHCVHSVKKNCLICQTANRVLSNKLLGSC